MQALAIAVLLSCFSAMLAKPTGEMSDSYAIAPQLDQTEDIPSSDLASGLVPPNGAPHVYYMNSYGMAESAEDNESPKLLRIRRDVPANPEDETLLTDETVIIGPPSGQSPFGTPAIHLGYRPARAYYARRYHKYPWNYH